MVNKYKREQNNCADKEAAETLRWFSISIQITEREMIIVPRRRRMQ